MTMERVALFLQNKAISCSHGTSDFDLFGRSSFNRYYYATYLKVRSILGSLDEAWTTTAHNSIPDLLEGQIMKKIKRQRNRAIKLDDRSTVQICRRAELSARELADLMKGAYAVRVAADYYPNIAVEVDGRGHFRLNLVTVTTAQHWPARALVYGEHIQRAWRLVDG